MTTLRISRIAALGGLFGALQLVVPPGQAASPVYCGSRVATIVATESGQVITGTDGPDVVAVGELYDVSVSTGDGDDLVCSSGVDVTISSGDGDDQVDAYMSTGSVADLGPGDDTFYGVFASVVGGPGDDVLRIEEGLALGGPGADFLKVRNSGTAEGGQGDDRIEAVYDPEAETYDSRMTLRGDAGDDSIEIARDGHTRADGGSGRNTLDLGGLKGGAVVDLARGRTVLHSLHRRGPLIIAATRSFADVEGTRWADRIYGKAGPNHLDGNRGDDLLRGLGGDDRLHGGKGRDVAHGDRGRDECEAEVRHSC